jgi:hypothetical protein
VGRDIKVEAEGLLARVLQHELDHLNGVLFIDHVRPHTLHLVLERPSEDGSEPQREKVPVRLEEVEAFYRFLRETRATSLPEAWEAFQGVEAR